MHLVPGQWPNFARKTAVPPYSCFVREVWWKKAGFGRIGRSVTPHGAIKAQSARRPVSRVLFAPRGTRRPFLWDAHCCAPHATNPGDRAKIPPRHLVQLSLHQAAGRPYSVLLPVGFALPPLLPGARCALTAPFHPCLSRFPWTGGLFSVALSLGSPPPAVSRHRISVEPGLSSMHALARTAVVQPSGRPLDAPGRRIRQHAAGATVRFEPAPSPTSSPTMTPVHRQPDQRSVGTAT